MTPIHTKQEVLAFLNYLEKDVRFATAKEPDWNLMVKLWSAEANGETIYYKTPEQLKTYENIRKDRSTYINTVNINYTICENMRKKFQSSTRKRTAESALLLSPLKIPQMEQAAAIITSPNNTNNNSNTILPLSERPPVIRTLNNASTNPNSDIRLPLPPRAPLLIAPRPSDNKLSDNHITNHQHEYTPPQSIYTVLNNTPLPFYTNTSYISSNNPTALTPISPTNATNINQRQIRHCSICDRSERPGRSKTRYCKNVPEKCIHCGKEECSGRYAPKECPHCPNQCNTCKRKKCRGRFWPSKCEKRN